MNEHSVHEDASPASQGPLEGLRILDISTVVAGPLASTLLADLGAEVIKIEIPVSGDPLRNLPPFKAGQPLWWKAANRNKKGITLDLRHAEGKQVFERLLPRFDVLVENFRPGTLARWGLDASRLFAIRPDLIILRVSGFGQTGPYRDQPGFARMFEALSGFASLCGEADGPPLHSGFPIGDSIAGLFGALGILAAVRHRDRHPSSPGQEIDLAATEALFRILDFLPIEYDQLGQVRGRSGNLSQYAAPSNVYRTCDGKWVSVSASTQRIFEHLAHAISRPDLLADPRFTSNPLRVQHCQELDSIISAWMRDRSLATVCDALVKWEVGFSPVYTIKEIFEDEHFRARGSLVAVPDSDLGTVKMQAVVPRFSRTPGAVTCVGPKLGEHNAVIYGEWLCMSPEQLQDLQDAGVI